MFPQQLDVACGLAFDIEKAPTRSGFKPAQFDLGAGKELFGNLRIQGFAALLRLGFAHRLIIFGGNEGRYKDATPPINRGWAITQMLIHDHGIDPNQVDFRASNANTGGNIEAIKRVVDDRASAVVSNHYHLPRAALDMASAGLRIPCYPAETFLLLEDRARKNELIEKLGGGELAERMVEEIQGIADKLVGTYRARTNANVP